MLNPEQKLNENFFDIFAEKKSMREGFGKALVSLGEKDEKIVVLTADLKESTQVEKFSERFPNRFVDVGITEQNLVSVASGLSAMGKIVVATSYAMFNPGRNWEQIRTNICYNDQPVKIVGSHSGLNVGADGGSHQALEDIALTRVLPSLIVLSPCDSVEAGKATKAMMHNSKPTYLRLAREKLPVITTDKTPFEIGKAQTLWESENPSIGIVATGSLVANALKAAEILQQKHNLETIVLNFSTIKPLDENALLDLAEKVGGIVSVEEHQKFGGFGSAVAEVLAEKFPTPMAFVAVDDKFGQSGTMEELWDFYGLSVEAIVTKVLELHN
jgi:transketolase